MLCVVFQGAHVKLIATGRKVIFDDGWEGLPRRERVLPAWKVMPPLLKWAGGVFERVDDTHYRRLDVPDVDYMPVLIHFEVEGDLDGYETFCGKGNRGGKWGSVTDDWEHVTCSNCLKRRES